MRILQHPRFLVFSFLIFFAFTSFGQASVTLCSWNLKDFGKSKSDPEIEFIANTIKNFDIIAIQEVVAGDGGAQAVARLNTALNRKGAKWDYKVSEVTSGSSYKSERYAFIWKTSRVKQIGETWLEQKYGLLIDREPYYCRFKYAGKMFTVVNFHAITKKMQPETEIKYFKFLPDLYPGHNLIFTGDFNLPQSHTVYIPLGKMGYRSALVGQKTSLKQKSVNGEYLASEFDNFYFQPSKITMIKTGFVPFYSSFSDLKSARLISDHVPIYSQFFVK